MIGSAQPNPSWVPPAECEFGIIDGWSLGLIGLEKTSVEYPNGRQEPITGVVVKDDVIEVYTDSFAFPVHIAPKLPELTITESIEISLPKGVSLISSNSNSSSDSDA